VSAKLAGVAERIKETLRTVHASVRVIMLRLLIAKGSSPSSDETVSRIDDTYANGKGRIGK
jgi:hypothetical protein